MSEKREIKVMKQGVVLRIKNDTEPQPSRSELTLLYELIKRNPERAKEFLRRLGESVKAAA